MVKGRKPNLKGANLARRILAMSNDDISDSKKRLIRWTVTEGTAESYDSKIKEIKSFAEVLGKNPVSFSTRTFFNRHGSGWLFGVDRIDVGLCVEVPP